MCVCVCVCVLCFALAGSHWGGWQFKIMSVSQGNTSGNTTAATFALDPWGGQQEARGQSKGAEWHLENLLEELDVGREVRRRALYNPQCTLRVGLTMAVSRCALPIRVSPTSTA